MALETEDHSAFAFFSVVLTVEFGSNAALAAPGNQSRKTP
jgi:hypothetical protein